MVFIQKPCWREAQNKWPWIKIYIYAQDILNVVYNFVPIQLNSMTFTMNIVSKWCFALITEGGIHLISNIRGNTQSMNYFKVNSTWKHDPKLTANPSRKCLGAKLNYLLSIDVPCFLLLGFPFMSIAVAWLPHTALENTQPKCCHIFSVLGTIFLSQSPELYMSCD